MVHYMHVDWLKSLNETNGFQWDKGNDTKSASKHHVTCYEAESIFRNRPLVIGNDIAHSKTEPRAFALGKTNEDRLLYISFTIRNDLIRVISARPMNKKEKNHYEKIQETQN